MSKSNHRIIVLNVKGADKAIAGTDDMIESVVDALRNQFPMLKITTTTYVGEQVEKPILMVPTKFQTPQVDPNIIETRKSRLTPL